MELFLILAAMFWGPPLLLALIAFPMQSRRHKRERRELCESHQELMLKRIGKVVKCNHTQKEH